jgi:predicted nucleic acid-binding protein
MRILVDTNLFLDIALKRKSFHANSRLALRRCTREGEAVMIAWHTLSNLFYVVRKERGREFAMRFIRRMLEVVSVASVDHDAALLALSYGMADFEDGLQVAAAERNRANIIVTRNKSDFSPPAGILVLTPEEFLQFTPQ